MPTTCPKCRRLTVECDPRTDAPRCYAVDCSWIGEGRQRETLELQRYKRALDWACQKAEPSIPCPNGLENCDRDGHWECWQCVEEMALNEASK